MNCQFLDRSDLRSGLKIINKAVELVKEGSSVCIFPEGTRNKGTDILQPFHDGSLKIAEKAGCPIVPVTINGSAEIFEAQFPKVKKTTVVIEYSKPIETEGLSRQEFRELSGKVQETIKANYVKNLELLKG